MRAPHTFVYVENRDGVPYQASEYICQHGYESASCGVSRECPAVGQSMILWWNGLDKQMREREVDRTRLINGS